VRASRDSCADDGPAYPPSASASAAGPPAGAGPRQGPSSSDGDDSGAIIESTYAGQLGTANSSEYVSHASPDAPSVVPGVAR
jgi:hypothetical protein